MKKMLAVCAACMVAGLASADVTSDNIVGFISTPSVEGFNWVAPDFNTVGADTIALSNISISDGNQGGIGWGTEILQILDDGGAVIGQYFYNDPAMDPDGVQTGYYWGDETSAAVEANLSAGEAYLLYTAGQVEYIITGQVPNDDVTLTSIEGFNFVGNPFPAPIELSAITISDGGQGSIGWGTEILQVLDDGGAVVGQYFYNDPAMDPDGAQTDYYWGDETSAAVSATLDPGAGRLLYTAAADLEITFAKPYTL